MIAKQAKRLAELCNQKDRLQRKIVSQYFTFKPLRKKGLCQGDLLTVAFDELAFYMDAGALYALEPRDDGGFCLNEKALEKEPPSGDECFITIALKKLSSNKKIEAEELDLEKVVLRERDRAIAALELVEYKGKVMFRIKEAYDE